MVGSKTPRTPSGASPPATANEVPSEPAAAQAAAPSPVTVLSVASRICSQCGRSFPQDQVVTFDNQIICAACKPMFVQRLREGVTLPGILTYAGFWIRAGAKIIDGLIMAALQYAVLIPMGFLAFSSTDGPGIGMILFSQLISIGIPLVYNTFFIGRFAATPGKMACRLKVVAPDGDRISYARALGRNFAEMISGMILAIGYLMAAFDEEKRTLHDRVCSTRVIHK
jgi:uncharacterized RDD family membrane protein YckC